MKTIQWRCVNGGDFVSRAIDFISRGAVCHTEFIVGTQSLGSRADGGVQYRPLDNYPVDYRFSAQVTDEQYSAVMGFLGAQVGKPYNDIAIVGILDDQASLENLEDKKAWYCSQLWAAAMQESKIIAQLPKAVTNVTPEDALLISSAMGWATK